MTTGQWLYAKLFDLFVRFHLERQNTNVHFILNKKLPTCKQDIDINHFRFDHLLPRLCMGEEQLILYLSLFFHPKLHFRHYMLECLRMVLD